MASRRDAQGSLSLTLSMRMLGRQREAEASGTMPMPAPASTMRQTASNPVTRALTFIDLPSLAACPVIWRCSALLAGQPDKGPVDDVGQGQGPLPPKAVPSRQHHDEGVVAKRKLLDRVWQSSRGGNPNVGGARRKGRGNVRALPLLDVEADARIGSQELGQNFRQVLAQCCRVGDKPHTAR